MERKTKGGRKIIAEVKSYLVTTKMDISVGTLDKRGETGKLFASVNKDKVIPAGTKACIRFGVKKFNGNYLVYLHSFGWTEVTNFEETFISTKPIKEDLLQNDYENLNITEKINAFKRFFPDYFSNLTKTEKMLMAYLEDKDLSEVEKEIAADSSLKYKIKKNTKEYEESFLKKLEGIKVA